MWQGDVSNQMDEIKEIVHPVTGIFQCVMGLADFSNFAIGLIAVFEKEGIPVAGVSLVLRNLLQKRIIKMPWLINLFLNLIVDVYNILL